VVVVGHTNQVPVFGSPIIENSVSTRIQVHDCPRRIFESNGRVTEPLHQQVVMFDCHGDGLHTR
jgi:hypothetical protein